MIPVSTSLLHGAVLCLPFTIFAVGSFWWRPRLWLHSLPPDIRERAAEKTAGEKALTQRLMMPIAILLLPVGAIVSTLIAGHGMNATFWSALRHLVIVWCAMQAWDFVAIDGTHVLLIDPQHPPIPGTEEAHGWKDMRFHFREMMRAVIIGLPFLIASALCIAALT